MRTGADTAFAAFVEDEHEALLRLARLLEDDPRDADLLVRGALARVRRRWHLRRRREDLAAAARAAVVRQVLSRRPAGGSRTSGWADDFEAAWDADGSAGLRRELAELPVRTRTATVLVRWAGLPVEQVADLLRDDPDAVRADVAVGTARLGSVLAPVPPAWHRGSAGAAPPAEDLARRLTALADEAAPTPSPAVLAGTARRDARTVRRRWLAGAAAACAAVAVAVPALVGTGPAAGPDGPVAEPTEGAQRPSPPVDVLTLPVRGSLAEDEEFLAELRAIDWASSEEWGLPPEYWPRREDRRVLFAGDVPGGRWALVVGTPAPLGEAPDPVYDDEVVLAWFTGPRGAPPSDMVLSSYPRTVTPDPLPSLLDPRTGTMVVVAAPGDVVEISGRPEVGADGSRTRDWQRVESADGVAVARLETTGMPWMWSASYRVLRGEQSPGTPGTGIPDVLVTDDAAELPPLGVRYPEGRPPAGQRQAAEDAAGMVLTQLGLSPGSVQVTALVTAALPAPAAGELALIGVRVPSGAVVLTGSWTRRLPDGSATMGECGTDVRPAGAPVTQRVVAGVCDLWDPATGEPEGSVLVVSAPPSVAAVRTYDGDGSYLGEHAVRDGRLVVRTAPGASEVEAVTADGVLLGRSALLSTGMWLGE